MLRHIHDINSEDHVTNDSKREMTELEAKAVNTMRRILQWYGHVYRRDREEEDVAEMRVQERERDPGRDG